MVFSLSTNLYPILGKVVVLYTMTIEYNTCLS